jgi:adenosylmethionine---8-amino-7-oxononanoate aminotransferase
MSDLLNLDKKNIWHPFTPLLGAAEPLLIKSANGVYLNTHDGRKIIDAISSWWVNIHGHSHPYIAEALARQASTLEHVIFAGFTHEPAITLSKNLLTILPKNQSKLFFSDNGSTAVEVALKMAFQYWHNQKIERQSIIALNGAYHGDTFGAMSVGERSLFTTPFTRYLFDTQFVDFPDAASEQKVFNEFKRIIDKENVAAFIFEPLVQGASGMRMYRATILDQMINYAQQHDVICIADEVFTGFGRTGKLFASHYLTYSPDIIAMSKGLTGGTLPLGITSCSQKISRAFETDDFSKTFFHGHSYTANPLSCAAANASFDLLMTDECQSRIAAISEWNLNFIAKIKISNKIRDVRSTGTILSIELNTEETTAYANTMRKKIYPYFLDRNVLLRPLGNVIYILPPYVITNDQLDYIGQTVIDFLQDN